MKKLIIFGCCLLFSHVMQSKVTVVKNGWGLFRTWYKYVTQENYNGGDVLVVCQEPGFTRCKVQPLSIVFPGDPPPLGEENYQAIDDYVESHITETDRSGNFIYNSSYYVTYVYDPLADTLTTVIYSLIEAQSLNLI